MSKWVVDINGEIEGDYELIEKYEEPKTGNWIKHDESITLLTGYTATGGVICSECGYKTHNKPHVIVGCPYKYCPNCGAKMKSEGKE